MKPLVEHLAEQRAGDHLEAVLGRAASFGCSSGASSLVCPMAVSSWQATHAVSR